MMEKMNDSQGQVYFKQYMKLNVLLPVFIGLIIGVLLCMGPLFDKIPGLPLVLLISCFLLIYYGVRNINKVNEKNKLIIIMPLLFGATGIAWTLILSANGEGVDSPGLLVFLVALFMGSLFVGLFNIKKIRQKLDPGIAIPVVYCACGVILAIIAEFDGDISTVQRLLIITGFLVLGALSIGAIMLARKLINRNKI